MRYWIALGKSVEDLQVLLLRAAQGTEVEWTLHGDAKARDQVLFYWTEPLGAFIAQGRVARRSRRRWQNTSGESKPMACLTDIQMLPTPVLLAQAQAELPGAKWLKTPRGLGVSARPEEDCEHIIGMGRTGLLAFAVPVDALPPFLQDAVWSGVQKQPSKGRSRARRN